MFYINDYDNDIVIKKNSSWNQRSDYRILFEKYFMILLSVNIVVSMQQS